MKELSWIQFKFPIGLESLWPSIHRKYMYELHTYMHNLALREVSARSWRPMVPRASPSPRSRPRCLLLPALPLTTLPLTALPLTALPLTALRLTALLLALLVMLRRARLRPRARLQPRARLLPRAWQLPLLATQQP